ncbi:LuxR family transcriptional regulator [Asanoa ferruginea]|nr:LuxR family transcriptional regulator [Asanoa ferruginea]
MNELADARVAARRAIEQLHLTPVMFELGARPYPPRDLYLAYLNQSDVFVAIYGESYGTIEPGRDVSGLEDEFLAAGGKPQLVYVQLPAPDREPRLAEMLERVARNGVSYRTFAHPDELVALIGGDLALLLSERFNPAAETKEDAPKHDDLHRLTSTNRFIGRRHELETLRALATDPQTRLVTLVGPGGIGKTRLAVELVATVAPTFESIATVDLDQLSAPEQVPPAIAAALGVPETPGVSLGDAIAGSVDAHRILLLLDSFEHVIDVAPMVADLVARTSRLTVLVTSREPLHLSGENVFEVPPLGVPEWSDSTDDSQHSDAVQLFADRAAAAGVHLRLDAAQVRTISKICRRLDGLPLAIELAAPRTRMLELDDLMHRLDSSLDLLSPGARDLPSRQRTLHSTIAWSYDLLDEPDRVLFARLGVFAGSFRLEAAETICGAPVFDGLASLVDKALLRPDHSVHGEPRFAMLEIVRDFATGRLEDAGEARRLREQHAVYFRQLTLDIGAAVAGSPKVRPLVQECVADHDNLRAAVRWFIDEDDIDSAVRMGLAIWPVLFTQGLASDFEEAMARVVAGPALSDDNRANARLVLGMMAFLRANYDRAADVLPPAYDRFVERGDERAAATAVVALALMGVTADPGRSERQLLGAVDTFRRLDEPWWLMFALCALGSARVTMRHERDAIAPLEEGGRLAARLEDDVLASNGLIALGWAHLRLGDAAAAARELDQALDRAVTFGSRETIPRALDGLAAVAEETGDTDRAATLFGAALGVRGTLGSDVWSIDQPAHAEIADHLRSRLGDEPYGRLTARGASLALDDVLELAARP